MMMVMVMPHLISRQIVVVEVIGICAGMNPGIVDVHQGIDSEGTMLCNRGSACHCRSRRQMRHLRCQ